MDFYRHYIRLDGENNLIFGFSDAFEEAVEGDVLITEKGGRHFELDGVINPSLFTNDGRLLYRYIDNKIRHVD
jgi:hypothetical protein